ncbi:MAG: NADH-ubiquinone oxidoreductase chain C (EC [uncultured Campylobacterales bacterium]|uniref:NADH-quinone oxidoreductase subunit C n=1 Tax=uncultured Campylobacterales bacterium TaxID=352960 RepID=A0A6S6SJS7_9BACT|nr:MAG: NADH-ubiquinone oxidoreductase chain C (EC [uncultured Campylobacterales bacterium]
MRTYKPKKNVQHKAYHTDRFYVAPTLAKIDPSTDEVFSKDLKLVEKNFSVEEAYIQNNHLVIYVKPTDIYKVLELLKDSCKYQMLIELSAIDFVEQSNEFEIFYQLLSLTKKKRIRLKTKISADDKKIKSVCDLYKSANWAEREAYDMFGIKFVSHPNLKRILMPDDWYDHPLLKTYPVEGDESASWYEVDKIYGKEYRDIVGPELRDPAYIDRLDSKRFIKIKHEVPYGAEISETPTNMMSEYQEEKGVFLVRKLRRAKSKILKKRR